MIDRGHDLPITKQAEVLRISRGSVYYLPRPVPVADLAMMRRIDQLHLEFPFAGSRMLRGLLAGRGVQDRPPSREDADAADGDRGALSPSAHDQARARPQDLPVSAARAGDHAAEPGVGDGHHLHPDGARLRLPRRGARLVQPPRPVVAAVDHDGGGVLRRDAGGRLGAHGKPEIFNTDQGSQFTGQAFTGVLAGNGIAISMDGKGAWRDNVFVERLWRSVKYEEVYLRAYDSVSEARASIGRYFDFYNGRRPHASLDGNTPDQAYFNPLPIRMAA